MNAEIADYSDRASQLLEDNEDLLSDIDYDDNLDPEDRAWLIGFLEDSEQSLREVAIKLKKMKSR